MFSRKLGLYFEIPSWRPAWQLRPTQAKGQFDHRKILLGNGHVNRGPGKLGIQPLSVETDPPQRNKRRQTIRARFQVDDELSLGIGLKRCNEFAGISADSYLPKKGQTGLLDLDSSDDAGLVMPRGACCGSRGANSQYGDAKDS